MARSSTDALTSVDSRLVTWKLRHHQFLPTPPRHLKPMTSRKPNLFVIGAMKSGTTYLTKLLESHPSIFMCRPEEPSYFVDPKLLRKLYPDIWFEGYWKSQENYLALFKMAGNAAILGESSTNYSKRPQVLGVPEKIRQFNPDARLIYVMRDPIERTISHYWHMVRYHAERRSIVDAIKNDPQFCDVSHYAMQLAPFLECFGRQQVKLFTFEELASSPKETLKPIYEWLNVNHSVEPNGAEEAENVTPKVVNMASLFGIPQRLRQSPILRSVIPRLPHSVRQIGLRLSTKPIERQAIETAKVVEFLRPVQREQTNELARLVGREFPEWRTLYERPLIDD